MRDVAIIGVGMTKFGEHWDRSFRELGIEAGFKAIVDAGIESRDVDALYVGNMSGGLFLEQEHVASMISEAVGFTERNLPAVRVEAADASGGVAFQQAVLSVASGIHDTVVVGGAEKMSDLTSIEVTDAIASVADRSWEALFGATLPSLYALMARRHMVEFGTTREQMAQVAVKNHYNGARNPYAQFQREIKLSTVLNATPVAEPLGMFDCAPISDGAAAVVITTMDKAKEMGKDILVRVAGIGLATDTLALARRKTFTSFPATRAAAERAYKMAGVGPKDVDVAEVHDSYTIGEILAIEDLGFFKKGEGGIATEEGRTSLEGEIPVNTSGGLKARGHPLGATGVAQIVELVWQLRGEAEGRQVKDARIGLAHNVGGAGGTVAVTILEVI
ncbi:MAG: thiolase domain-containing protein [Thermoplasmata archaeon]|nr:thiolase domain-containing protein [Thermoplasmata archaeon]